MQSSNAVFEIVACIWLVFYHIITTGCIRWHASSLIWLLFFSEIIYILFYPVARKKNSLVSFLSWSLYSGCREANTRKWAKTLAQGHRKRDSLMMINVIKQTENTIGEDSTFKYSVLIKRKNDFIKLRGLGVFTLYEFLSKMTPVIWQSCHQSPKISKSLKF